MIIGIDANEANLTDKRVGVNQYAFELLWAINNLQSEHQFIIYLKSQPQDDLPKEKNNWKYRVIPFPKLWTQTRLPFDLFFHSPRPDVFFSMTHYAPRWSPVPTVIAVMDLGFLQTPEQFTAKDFNQLKSWTKYSVKNASKILAISEYTKKDIVREYEVDPKNIVVTHLGINANMKPVKEKNKYGKYILFLGSLKPSKNIEGIVRAFAQVSGNYQLVIAGKKAWLFEKIFSVVKELKLEDRVIFTDFVKDEERPVLMSNCEAFVMPSFYEGFGIPALEAMACGAPVVVSPVASIPEVVGDAGIYVDPKNPEDIAKGIQKAIKEKEKYIKLGLERVKLFSWAKCAQKTLLCLETVTEKN